ncbi:hypothetical protein GOP47_0002799 [Adiantum capillus-veneris]|uniref:Tify domain-containing protein n=1 Tax=Adiantum capillus-veneris TaxID=13818 RepID=A0A9D4VAR7_ADICA|nr:hypothetical protein GOP47_0002799 [Adiantum capillus-veneris]
MILGYLFLQISQVIREFSMKSPNTMQPTEVQPPLTIFYDGKVAVYANTPAYKITNLFTTELGCLDQHAKGLNRSTRHTFPLYLAEAIMMLLCNDKDKHNNAREGRLHIAPSKPSCPMPFGTNKSHKQLAKRSQAELPFARKASLARFLEKRKTRVEARHREFGCQNDETTSVMDGGNDAFLSNISH